MNLGGIDEKTGLPMDKRYLECGLPDWLEKSIEQMKAAWDKLDNGEVYVQWDCDWCELQSDINVAEVEQIITPEQAWYLREKYLRLERIHQYAIKEKTYAGANGSKLPKLL